MNQGFLTPGICETNDGEVFLKHRYSAIYLRTSYTAVGSNIPLLLVNPLTAVTANTL